MPRATPLWAARSRAATARSAPTGLPADATRRSPSRSSARHYCRRSFRTPRSPAYPPGAPRATSRGSTTPGSELDCDPVVDPPEDPGADAEGNDRRDEQIDDIGPVRDAAVVQRRAERLQGRRDEVPPAEHLH